MVTPSIEVPNLSGWVVALSGSVPAQEELEQNHWSELDYRYTVSHLVHAVLDAGGHLVHGSHPTYLRFVETVALQLGPDPVGGKRVRMLTIPNPSFFPTEDNWRAFVQRHSLYADVETVGNRGTPLPEALQQLSHELIQGAQALVCIGGRSASHSLAVSGPSLQKPQVQWEVEEAVRHRLPVYLAGAYGGLSRQLYNDLFAHRIEDLNNGLDDAENLRLAKDPSPSGTAALVLQGLARIQRPPVGGYQA